MLPISLLNWMLLSTVLLGAWWLCYRLVLRTERSFAYNRAFLLLGPVLAAGLPLLPLSWPSSWGAAPGGVASVLSVQLPTVQVGGSGPAETDWIFWAQVLYLSGVGLSLARLGYGLGRLWWAARALPRETRPGYTLVRTGGQLPTSTFGRVVLWDDTLSLSDTEAQQVLRHELAHLRQGHTYDRLLLAVLQAVLWFNPFVYLCGRALALTHEFLADEAALRAEPTAAPTFYTRLLARQVATRLGFSVPLAHSFSQSQTLSRIAMIQKTSPVHRWKQWLAVPLLGTFLFTIACQSNTENVEPTGTPIPTVQLDGDVGAPPPPTPIPNMMPETNQQGRKVYTYVEQMPHLPGDDGIAGIVKAIQREIKFPTTGKMVSGRVFVQFVVSEQGQVGNVVVIKGLSPAQDAAVVAAVQKLPRFVAGSQNKIPAAVSFTVPVQFGTPPQSWFIPGFGIGNRC